MKKVLSPISVAIITIVDVLNPFQNSFSIFGILFCVSSGRATILCRSTEKLDVNLERESEVSYFVSIDENRDAAVSVPVSAVSPSLLDLGLFPDANLTDSWVCADGIQIAIILIMRRRRSAR